MPAPLHMVTFATKAAISAFDFSTWPDGTPVACLENYTWYLLKKNASNAVDGESVLTSASGRFFKVSVQFQGGVTVATEPPFNTPTSVGQVIWATLDTGTPTERMIQYISIGTSSTSDWIAVGGSAVNADDSPIFYNVETPEFSGQIWNNSLSSVVYIGINLGNGLEWANLNVLVGTIV